MREVVVDARAACRRRWSGRADSAGGWRGRGGGGGGGGARAG